VLLVDVGGSKLVELADLGIDLDLLHHSNLYGRSPKELSLPLSTPLRIDCCETFFWKIPFGKSVLSECPMQSMYGTRALYVTECPLKTLLPVTMTNLSDGLRGHKNDGRDPWRAHSFRHLWSANARRTTLTG
jgi:hypothetical protein